MDKKKVSIIKEKFQDDAWTKFNFIFDYLRGVFYERGQLYAVIAQLMLKTKMYSFEVSPSDMLNIHNNYSVEFIPEVDGEELKNLKVVLHKHEVDDGDSAEK